MYEELQSRAEPGHSKQSCLSCRYMRADHFGSWGRPFEYNAQLYRSLNRAEEARDSVSHLQPAPLDGMQELLHCPQLDWS